MLPTPSTSHVPYSRVYEPAEDSFLLLDTLSSASETAFLSERFKGTGQDAAASPLVVEIGTGSGVVLAFATAHAGQIFGRPDILALGTDVNLFACVATARTASDAVLEARTTPVYGKAGAGQLLDPLLADLVGPLRPGCVDVLIFNPPYVPTSELPQLPRPDLQRSGAPSFDEDSHLLALSYSGGVDGMETTERLLQRLPEVLSPRRGVAYVLLCAQNRPEKVKERIKGLGPGWDVETVRVSGKKAGWEKLQVVRIWRTTNRTDD